MKPWGRLVLKEYGEMMAEKGKGDRKPALRRPATRGTPKAGPKKDDQARVRRRRKKDETADAGAGLREKLKALRGRLHRGEEPKKAEAILITESEESTEESSAAEETEEHVTRLSVGDKLARAELPALLDMKKERGAESPRRADPKKAKKKRKSPGDPQAQLLAQAAQTRALKVAADKKKKNKGSGGGSRKVKALVEALIEEKTGKEQKDAKKDSKKKKKKRRVQGGDRPGVLEQWGRKRQGPRGGGDRQLIERDVGPLTEEIEQEAWSCSSNVGPTRKGHVGPSGSGGDGGQQGCDGRREAGDVLQLDGAALSQPEQPRHERVEPPRCLSGRAEVGSTRSLRRLVGGPFPGNPHGGKRRELAERPTPGASPSRSSPGCSHVVAARGQEAWQAGQQEPRPGAMEKGPRRRRWLAQLWQGRRRKRKRKEQGQRLSKRRRRRRAVAARSDVAKVAKGQELVGVTTGQDRWQGCEGSLEGGETRREVEEPQARGSELVRTVLTLSGWRVFGKILEGADSMRKTGCLLAWLAVRAEQVSTLEGTLNLLSCVLPGFWCWLLCRASLPQEGGFPYQARQA